MSALSGPCIVWYAGDLVIGHVREGPPFKSILLLVQGACREDKRGGFLGFLKALLRPCLGRNCN